MVEFCSGLVGKVKGNPENPNGDEGVMLNAIS